MLVTRRIAEGRSSQEVAALAAGFRAEASRLRTMRTYPTGLDLAAAHDRNIVRTPALDLLNERLNETVSTFGGRLVISLPPQEGKSSLTRWTCAKVLIHNPETRLAYISYAASLARTAGRIVRGLIKTHSKSWGLSISQDHADASDWELRGRRGGMIAVGREGTITGRPAEGVFIDDPLKNRKEADSPVILQSLHDIWEAVVRTRLAPGAFVVVIQTRWTEKDLAGRFEDEGWPVVNIPALADGKVPDALNRPVGTYLVSARGRTEAEWKATRADVGEYEWSALFQGAPSPPGGGWFLEAWFDRDRVREAPEDTLPPVVYIDPADNTGGGDEAGIVVGRADARRHIYVGPDYSDHYTIARWVRVALLAVIRHEASALVYESSLSGLPKAVRDGWAELRKQALVLRKHCIDEPWPFMLDERSIVLAMTELVHEEDSDETSTATRNELLELWEFVPAVLRYPENGPATRKITPVGSKIFRIQTASQPVQQRRVHIIGRLPPLEHEARTWRPGKPSPNRLDTLVHMIHDLGGAVPASISRPDGRVPARSTRRHQTMTLPRSSRR